jgi:hypothetical protein
MDKEDQKVILIGVGDSAQAELLRMLERQEIARAGPEMPNTFTTMHIVNKMNQEFHEKTWYQKFNKKNNSNNKKNKSNNKSWKKGFKC